MWQCTMGIFVQLLNFVCDRLCLKGGSNMLHYTVCVLAVKDTMTLLQRYYDTAANESLCYI